MIGLGELESAVMDALWNSEEPARVRDVMDRRCGRSTILRRRRTASRETATGGADDA